MSLDDQEQAPRRSFGLPVGSQDLEKRHSAKKNDIARAKFRDISVPRFISPLRFQLRRKTQKPDNSRFQGDRPELRNPTDNRP
jgi:hypothetical protein